MLIGAHVSNAGGLSKAVERGAERGCHAIQIFNQSPRMWRPTAYGDDDFTAFRDALKGTGIKAVLIHAVYLINCASEDGEIRTKSRASLIQSLRVGAGIGAVSVVLHPGSAKQGEVGKAIKRAGKVIEEALSESDGCPLHLEDTAGAGGTLGRSFEELAALIEAAGDSKRVGVCLDSCHLLASGYDIRTADGLTDDARRVRLGRRPQAAGIAARQRLDDPSGLKPRPPCAAWAGRIRREGVRDVPVRAALSAAPLRARDRQRGRLPTSSAERRFASCRKRAAPRRQRAQDAGGAARADARQALACPHR